VIGQSAAQSCPTLVGPNVWGDGNILLGGAGNDLIEGRGADDIIDGDAYVSVRLSVRTNPNDPASEIGSASVEGPGQSAMTSQYLRTSAGALTGPTLQQAVFAGTVNPGNIVAVRELKHGSAGTLVGTNPDNALTSDCPTATADPAIIDPALTPSTIIGTTVKLTAGTTNCDTAVFSGQADLAGVDAPDAYTVTRNANGSITVADPVSDGVDTLWNVENLRFCIHNDPVKGVCDAFTDVTAPAPVVAPAQPVIGTITPQNGAALVNFTPGTGGGTVTGFTVQALSGTSVVASSAAVPGDTSATVTGLTNGVPVTFRVIANGPGGSTASAVSAPATPAPQPPGAPTIGTATAAVGGASFTWTAPANNNGAPIDTYTVEVRDSVSNALVKSVTIPAPATSTLVTGLTAGQAVKLRVAAHNSAGLGAFSGLSNTVTVIADSTAPVVAARSPLAGAVNVPLGSVATATFSEPVQGVSNTTFTLRIGNGAAIAATVTMNSANTVATLTPSAPLVNNTVYTARLTGGATGIRDLANNPLVTTTWTFRANDVVAPTVVTRTPVPNAIAVAVGDNVVVTFSEAVTVPNNAFTLTQGARTAVRAAVTSSNGGRTWTLNPNANLAAGQTFTVNLTNAIRDLVGNRLVAVTWTFRT
jgi:hypothetical protein